MTHLTLTFGKEQVQKMHNGQSLTIAEKEQYVKIYSFNTHQEAKAFQEGIEAVIGWQEVYYEDLEK